MKFLVEKCDTRIGKLQLDILDSRWMNADDLSDPTNLPRCTMCFTFVAFLDLDGKLPGTLKNESVNFSSGAIIRANVVSGLCVHLA